ncbi:hypothetical protein llap_16076 [Limosa lapponica baueri]|uniref:Secreted protein n=1 Tax=Limosa lapponica baueri TaxID=1758121 RepID=A0A2I0TIN3_LIMLA|nr:hypothetical protein llap_16076 [Limosa lapponica baueri]
MQPKSTARFFLCWIEGALAVLHEIHLYALRGREGALHVILEVPESFSPTLIARPGLRHGFQQHAGQLTATPKPKEGGKKKKRTQKRNKRR